MDPPQVCMSLSKTRSSFILVILVASLVLVVCHVDFWWSFCCFFVSLFVFGKVAAVVCLFHRTVPKHPSSPGIYRKGDWGDPPSPKSVLVILTWPS